MRSLNETFEEVLMRGWNSCDSLDFDLRISKIIAKGMPGEQQQCQTEPQETKMIAKGEPKSAQGAPKGPQGHPKGAQEALKGPPKSSKIALGGHLGNPRKLKSKNAINPRGNRSPRAENAINTCLQKRLQKDGSKPGGSQKGAFDSIRKPSPPTK